jgi:hypothetical protein
LRLNLNGFFILLLGEGIVGCVWDCFLQDGCFC